MFGEKLKTLRKSKGYTQEELAIKLNVVRQTISKWEKNLSVPDADMLSKIADVLEISVTELLGGDINQDINSKNDIAEQLSKISEQMAIKNRRNKKICRCITVIIAIIIAANFLFLILNCVAFNHYKYTGTYTVTQENVEIIDDESGRSK